MRFRSEGRQRQQASSGEAFAAIPEGQSVSFEEPEQAVREHSPPPEAEIVELAGEVDGGHGDSSGSRGRWRPPSGPGAEAFVAVVAWAAPFFRLAEDLDKELLRERFGDAMEIIDLVRPSLLALFAVLGTCGVILAQHEGHLTEFAWIFFSIIFWATSYFVLSRKIVVRQKSGSLWLKRHLQ
mmetsp:Transcript_89071/g.191131  ORF Transcript_89071/g.191131 Transcript_89071/m.191131 type:complete len:182 (-) Transcript_89071:123-668(-)